MIGSQGINANLKFKTCHFLAVGYIGDFLSYFRIEEIVGLQLAPSFLGHKAELSLTVFLVASLEV